LCSIDGIRLHLQLRKGYSISVFRISIKQIPKYCWIQTWLRFLTQGIFWCLGIFNNNILHSALMSCSSTVVYLLSSYKTTRKSILSSCLWSPVLKKHMNTCFGLDDYTGYKNCKTFFIYICVCVFCWCKYIYYFKEWSRSFYLNVLRLIMPSTFLLTSLGSTLLLKYYNLFQMFMSNFLFLLIFFSQNRAEYERRVREQAIRFRDPSL